MNLLFIGCPIPIIAHPIFKCVGHPIIYFVFINKIKMQGLALSVEAAIVRTRFY
jgi:hypothetical protein